MKEKIIYVLEFVGSTLLLLLLIWAVYWYSEMTQGPLTTSESCSGNYVFGRYDLATLKAQCSGLSKATLIENIEYIFNINKDLKPSDKLRLLNDVEKNF